MCSRILKLSPVFSIARRNILISSLQPQSADNAKNSPVWSCNEWDPLEEVIVGRAANAMVPKLTVEVLACISPSKAQFYEKYGGKSWAQAVGDSHWTKLNEEIEELVKVFEIEGVTVQRPMPYDFSQMMRTPDFESQGFYGAMPRDSILVVGDEIIEATMTWRCRYFEFKCFRHLILDYWRRGAQWTMAPKPQLNHHTFDPDFSVGADDEAKFVTTEYEPCFDAADFIRAGYDVFAQRSQVTNLAGIEWVARHLASRGIRVHRLNFHDPRPMHIDATFSIVKPGVAFQNPDRPCIESRLFRESGWEIFNVPKPNFRDDSMLWLGSHWLSMNTLMLDTKRVLVEKDETGIQNLYKKVGVTPIPVRMKHAYGIGGGIHCWTSDIRRRGTMESYFNESQMKANFETNRMDQ